MENSSNKTDVQKGDTLQKIRGDRITWLEKGDTGCNHIGNLINRLDKLMMSCQGRLRSYTIHGRTKVREDFE